MGALVFDDMTLVEHIKKKTSLNNKDNISRTEAYLNYFKAHPDIKWSFLASMVSRNAGYNMCDLEGTDFPHILETKFRETLFVTYERANWLIFHDIFPQLLIYKYSTKVNQPLFHLLTQFQVSTFIRREWEYYWLHRNKQRLMNALIINEQNVIQKPVIEHPVFRNKVFHSITFQFEDWFHFSFVLFPTNNGELYGASVNGFRNVGKRIDLGKRLAKILFCPKLFPHFLDFANNNDHTGSRYDYEKYLHKKVFRTTPFLRTTFPIVPHQVSQQNDWSHGRKIPNSWLHGEVHHRHPIALNNWYEKKRNQLKAMVAISQLWKLRKD